MVKLEAHEVGIKIIFHMDSRFSQWFNGEEYIKLPSMTIYGGVGKDANEEVMLECLTFEQAKAISTLLAADWIDG